MSRLAGVLYVATGVLCECVYILLVGAMPGLTAHSYSVSNLFTGPLFSLGPALLILSGVATLVEDSMRTVACLLAGTLAVGGLALWSFPMGSSRVRDWLLLEPAVVSLLIAAVVLALVKKSWITALMGGLLSALLFVPGSPHLIRGLVFGSTPLTSRAILTLLTAVLCVASCVVALRFRKA